MKIAIDARGYRWAGVGRYTRNLLRGLLDAAADHRYMILVGSEADRDEVLAYGDERFSARMVEPSYYSWREQTVFWRQLEKIDADLWHFPHFNVPLLFSKPSVVTIHDVTRFYFPGQRQQSWLTQVVYEQVFRHAVETARGVICVSDTTKEALLELPLRMNGTLAMIHEGVDDRFLTLITAHDRQRVRMLIGSGAQYLLYVGVWMNHKNLRRVLEAYKLLLQEYPELRLVMTGKPRPGYVPVDRIAHQLGLSDQEVLFLDFVDDDLLPALYAEASCLMFPSLYEGFGLPALEALATGTGVVASNVSSFPELLTDEHGLVGVLVNPDSKEAIAAGVREVLTADSASTKAIERRKVLAAKYSWEQCAAKTLWLYEQVA